MRVPPGRRRAEPRRKSARCAADTDTRACQEPSDAGRSQGNDEPSPAHRGSAPTSSAAGSRPRATEGFRSHRLEDPHRAGRRVRRPGLQRVDDVSQHSLIPFIESAVEPGATVHTDGWQAYWTVPERGYEHERTIMPAQHDPAHVLMPGVHRVASLLKRWLLGTHQGSVGPEHLDAYLNEFTFRFNRRGSRRRGLLFLPTARASDPRRPNHLPQPDRQPTARAPTAALPKRSPPSPAAERPWRTPT